MTTQTTGFVDSTTRANDIVEENYRYGRSRWGEDFDLLVTMSQEAAEMPPIPMRNCRYAPVISELLRDYDARLKQIHPRLSANSLAGRAYHDTATTRLWDSLTRKEKQGQERINYDFNGDMDGLAQKMSDEQGSHQLSAGLLDRPVYERQSYDAGARLCFQACFRMVTDTVSDRFFGEDQVERALKHNGHSNSNGIVDDDTYLNMLCSSSFAEHCQDRITVNSFIGIDLATIGKVAQGIKAQRADRRVFGIVSLLSETVEYTGGRVWHTGVLLEADEGTVTYHDPSGEEGVGRANRCIDKDIFLRRWAHTFNRCHLVTATPA